MENSGMISNRKRRKRMQQGSWRDDINKTTIAKELLHELLKSLKTLSIVTKKSVHTYEIMLKHLIVQP